MAIGDFAEERRRRLASSILTELTLQSIITDMGVEIENLKPIHFLTPLMLADAIHLMKQIYQVTPIRSLLN
jgi:hypothetical protein